MSHLVHKLLHTQLVLLCFLWQGSPSLLALHRFGKTPSILLLVGQQLLIKRITLLDRIYFVSSLSLSVPFHYDGLLFDLILLMLASSPATEDSQTACQQQPYSCCCNDDDHHAGLTWQLDSRSREDTNPID